VLGPNVELLYSLVAKTRSIILANPVIASMRSAGRQSDDTTWSPSMGIQRLGCLEAVIPLAAGWPGARQQRATVRIDYMVGLESGRIGLSEFHSAHGISGCTSVFEPLIRARLHGASAVRFADR